MARFQYVSPDRGVGTSQEWPDFNLQYLWVDLGPQDQGRVEECVQKLYHAHPAAMESVLEGSRRRAMIFGDGDALVMVLAHIQSPLPDLTIHPLGVFLGAHFLVTVHTEDPDATIHTAWDHVARGSLLKHGPDRALYQLLLAHWERLNDLDREISQRIETLNVDVLKHPLRDLTGTILRMRRELVSMRKLLRPEVDIYDLLRDPDLKQIGDSTRPFFAQLANRIQALYDEMDTRIEGLSGSVEAYSSMQSNEINKVMRFLTVLSVLALPATTIASIYGMNFRIPELKWPWGYWYSLGLMLVITVVLLMALHRHSDTEHKG